MKILTTKIKTKQLLELYLIKSKTYEHKQGNKNNLTNLLGPNLNQSLSDFKIILRIIFNFHKNNKSILFIGLPRELESRVNSLTNHVAISNDFNLQGILSNSFSNLSNKKIDQPGLKVPQKYLNWLPKISRKPDLIVVLNSSGVENLMKESFIAKIPLVNFDISNSQKRRLQSDTYNMNCNADLINKNNNIFFICLNFLFKKFKHTKHNTRFKGPLK
jgi:ribosomal protein S2